MWIISLQFVTENKGIVRKSICFAKKMYVTKMALQFDSFPFHFCLFTCIYVWMLCEVRRKSFYHDMTDIVFTSVTIWIISNYSLHELLWFAAQTMCASMALHHQYMVFRLNFKFINCSVVVFLYISNQMMHISGTWPIQGCVISGKLNKRWVVLCSHQKKEEESKKIQKGGS